MRVLFDVTLNQLGEILNMINTNTILLANNFVQATAVVSGTPASKEELSTVFANMVHYGWTPSKEVIQKLQTYTPDDLTAFWLAAEPAFKEVTASDRDMESAVVYKNFPKEVLEKSEAEYWFCQILMYVGFSPDYIADDAIDRPVLKDQKNLKVLHLAKEDTLNNIKRELGQSKNRWNDQQKEFALQLATDKPSETINLSDFGFKENGIAIIKQAIESGLNFAIKDATDVMRLAAAMSDSDVSLRTKVKFKKFNRKERKILLSLLNKSNNLADDVAMRQQDWKKFLFQLHTKDYNFPKVTAVYGSLCQGELKSFSAKIENKVLTKDATVFDMLANRQGDLMRRFHKLYEVFGDQAVEAVVSMVDKLDTLQLLKLKKYVKTINDREHFIYAPKGNWTKAHFITRVEKDLSEQKEYVAPVKTEKKKKEKAVVTKIEEVMPAIVQIIADEVEQPAIQHISSGTPSLEALSMLIEKFKGNLEPAPKPMHVPEPKQAYVAYKAPERKVYKPIKNGKVKLSTESVDAIVNAVDAEIAKRMDVLFPEGVMLDKATSKIKLQTNDQKLSANYGRGTIFDMPENINFIRSASYWQMKDSGNIWFDNSWNFFDEKWATKGACCWNAVYSHTNEDNYLGNNAEAGAVFSGDPVIGQDIKGRGCQMIDLYIDKLVDSGVRYAVWNILSFNSQPFDAADDLVGTLQMGENAEEGNLYEPSRAQFVFEIKGQNLTKYVAYIDLVERKIVYMDANLYGHVHSAGTNGALLSERMPAFVEYLDTLPSVFDLFESVKAGETPILNDDTDVEITTESAYVFNSRNADNSYEKIEINSLLQ